MSARDSGRNGFAAEQPEQLQGSRQTTPAHDAPAAHPDTLAHQRKALGFDDIPVASPDEVKEEKKSKKWTKLLKNKEYANWKEDLKWALKADRDDEAAPKNPPEQPIDKKPQQKKPQEATADIQTDATAKTIDININFGELPKLSKPNIRTLSARLIYYLKVPFQQLEKLSDKQRSLVGGGLFVALLVLIGTVYVPDIFQSRAIKPAAPNTSGEDTTPTYATLVPESKSTSGTSWRRVSPPTSNPVYAYVDSIDNVAISVSQQPIPDSFQPNIDEKVAELAASYTATEKLNVGSTPIYIGTSTKGPQSVIFTKDNLLILIKSASKISEDSWTQYVDSLQ